MARKSKRGQAGGQSSGGRGGRSGGRGRGWFGDPAGHARAARARARRDDSDLF